MQTSSLLHFSGALKPQTVGVSPSPEINGRPRRQAASAAVSRGSRAPDHKPDLVSENLAK